MFFLRLLMPSLDLVKAVTTSDKLDDAPEHHEQIAGYASPIVHAACEGSRGTTRWLKKTQHARAYLIKGFGSSSFWAYDTRDNCSMCLNLLEEYLCSRF